MTICWKEFCYSNHTHTHTCQVCIKNYDVNFNFKLSNYRDQLRWSTIWTVCRAEKKDNCFGCTKIYLKYNKREKRLNVPVLLKKRGPIGIEIKLETQTAARTKRRESESNVASSRSVTQLAAAARILKPGSCGSRWFRVPASVNGGMHFLAFFAASKCGRLKPV